MTRKLVAALACRNQGSRLYGKPLQNLDVEKGITILDNIVDCLQSSSQISEVVLGIAESHENTTFEEFADRRNLRWVRGDEIDVLSRLVACGALANATDVFRVTSESPFPYLDLLEGAWAKYQEAGADALFLDDVIDGCGFEILSLDALKRSHAQGEARHRSELCTLYMRENPKKFDIIRIDAPTNLVRRDLRLTVDNPEDLVLARAVFSAFSDTAPNISVQDIVAFLDAHPALIELTAPFTEIGYQTMYVYGDDA